MQNHDFVNIYQRFFVGQSKKISEATRPLRELFSVPFFGYHRIDLQGNYTVLADRPDWAEYYLENRLYENDPFLKHPDTYRSGAILFSDFDASGALLEPWRDQVSVKEGVVLVDRSPDGVEFSVIAYDKHGYLQQLLLNHMPLLRTFTKHFKDSMGSLLQQQQTDGYRLSFDNYRQPTSQQNKISPDKPQQLLAAMGLKTGWEKLNALAPRERQCLRFACEGLSMREIALSLSLSPRTVECYFDNACNRLGCESKRELLGLGRTYHQLGLL